MASGLPLDRRSLWLGAPGSDDSMRSHDEIRIIKEMTNDEVEMFVQANNIDVAAAKELRNEPPHVQLAVLERGPLKACVNPSGALVARIRDAKRGVLSASGRYGGTPPPNTLDPTTNELDRFLTDNRIDQAGVASMRSEPLEVQKAVMARGPLVNTTNPSASLMARIRTVKLDAACIGMHGAVTAAASLAIPHSHHPLALDDKRRSSSIDNDHINDEAQKAIRKLNMGSMQPLEGAPLDNKCLQAEALQASEGFKAALT
mmetsp:Transcript_59964/g.118948  ORF Transcript_59964/g.118948 Transcript_59964/m.118948 type:complete len:259 (+) Transcript_59964:36-812(+)